MKTSLHSLLITAALFIVTASSHAQISPVYFSSLSSDHYQQDISRLKNHTAQVRYFSKKEQETYASYVKDANKYAYTALEDDAIIYDTLLLNRCELIRKKLKAANPGFPFDSIKVFINRSSVPNAYAIGESGTIFINLGLLLWVDNEDELAIILGHEFSHYFLHHFDQAIAKNITLFSSDDFKDEIKDIKKSRDGKYKRFKALMKTVQVNNGKHSQFKESEADSLSAVFLTKAGYNLDKAAIGILQLDHVDELFSADGYYDVKNIFEKAVISPDIFRVQKKYKGLSTVAVTMNADADFDSIKTHPDCIVRYKKLVPSNSVLPVYNCCKTLTADYRAIKERALTEIVRNLYETGNLTLCTHFCLFALQNGFTQPMFNYYIAASFSDMLLADKKLMRFSFTNANASQGSNLKKLQDFIFDLNQDNLHSIAAYFLNHNPDIGGEDYYFAQMRYDVSGNTAEQKELEKSFTTKLPTSKYNYLFKDKTKTTK